MPLPAQHAAQVEYGYSVLARQRHDELKAQNERIINGQMITQQLLRELVEEQKKTNELLNRILVAS